MTYFKSDSKKKASNGGHCNEHNCLILTAKHPVVAEMHFKQVSIFKTSTQKCHTAFVINTSYPNVNFEKCLVSFIENQMTAIQISCFTVITANFDVKNLNRHGLSEKCCPTVKNI